MFYLPPVPDPAVIDGGGHVEDSEKLSSYLVALSELFNITIDTVPAPTPGASGHIAWHNTMVSDAQKIADALKVTVTLPPLSVKSGDKSHVIHHNLIRQALIDIYNNAWNDATGGTVTDYTKDGKKWRVHTFTQPGSLTVKIANKPFRVLVAAGGGGGGGGGIYYEGSGGGGAGGLLSEENKTLKAQVYEIKVGAGGGGGSGSDGAGGRGADSSFGDLVAIGGGGGETYHTGGSGGGSGGGRYNWRDGGYPGTDGQGYPGASGAHGITPDQIHLSGSGGGGGGAGGAGNGGDQGGGGGAGKALDITGSLVTYSSGGGGGGSGSGAGATPGSGGGGTNQDGGAASPGAGGVVIISYQIGGTP